VAIQRRIVARALIPFRTLLAKILDDIEAAVTDRAIEIATPLPLNALLLAKPLENSELPAANST